MDHGSTWQTMPPCHFRRQRIENRSRVFIAKKISEKALCFHSGVEERVMTDYGKRKFAPPASARWVPSRGVPGGKKLIYESSHDPFLNAATKTKGLFSEIFFAIKTRERFSILWRWKWHGGMVCHVEP